MKPIHTTAPALCVPILCLLAGAASAQSVDEAVSKELPSLLSTYEGIHEHPELSHHEEHTSALLAGECALLK